MLLLADVPASRATGYAVDGVLAGAPVAELGQVLGAVAEAVVGDVVAVAVALELFGGGAPGAVGVGGVGDGAEEAGEPFGRVDGVGGGAGVGAPGEFGEDGVVAVEVGGVGVDPGGALLLVAAQLGLLGGQLVDALREGLLAVGQGGEVGAGGLYGGAVGECGEAASMVCQPCLALGDGLAELGQDALCFVELHADAVVLVPLGAGPSGEERGEAVARGAQFLG